MKRARGGLGVGIALVIAGGVALLPRPAATMGAEERAAWAALEVAAGDCRWRIQGLALGCVAPEQPCPDFQPTYDECVNATYRSRCAPVVHPRVTSGGASARSMMACWIVNGMRVAAACRCDRSFFDHCLGPCRPTGAAVDVWFCPGRFAVLRACPDDDRPERDPA